MSGMDLDKIERQWSAYGGMGNPRGADDYTDAGCRIFAEHAFRDVPAMIAELREARAKLAKVRAVANSCAITALGRDQARGYLDILILLDGTS